MPFESQVSAKAIQWDLIFQWPVSRFNIAPWGDAIDEVDVPLQHPPGMVSNDGTRQGDALGEYHVAGGAVSEWMDFEDDQYCYACRGLAPLASRNYKFWGWPSLPRPKTTAANMTAGSRQPSFRRVWWCQFLFKMESAGFSIGTESGIGLTAETGPWGNPPWFNQIAVSQPGGFGFVGNGLGTGFDYISMTPGVAAPGGIIEQVAVPPALAPMGAWNLAEFLIINSAPGRNASMVASMNGVPIVTRNWAAGPGQLPAYSPVTGYGYALRGQLYTPGGGVTSSWFWGGVEIRMGRFTPDGLEVTS